MINYDSTPRGTFFTTNDNGVAEVGKALGNFPKTGFKVVRETESSLLFTTEDSDGKRLAVRMAGMPLERDMRSALTFIGVEEHHC